MPGILRRTRAYLEFTLRPPGYFVDSSILPQILPQTSSQTQGNSRVSRMEHQTPSVFPGNFRQRKVLGTLCFPFCFPENLVQAKHTSFLSVRNSESPSFLSPTRSLSSGYFPREVYREMPVVCNSLKRGYIQAIRGLCDRHHKPHRRRHEPPPRPCVGVPFRIVVFLHCHVCR